MTAASALLALSHPSFAGPTGGVVVGGSATISQAGSVTNINQYSNQAIINWQSFSIGAKETVNFNQPSINSVILNRVIGNEQSVIAGALNANGKVFIVNSNGILFSKGSQVNVGGLVASTLDISNADFMAGNYTFSGASAASVVNRGHITAKSGGYVALLGKTVSNDGVIVAKLGTVAMASGEKITLNYGGDSLVDVTIDKGTFNALVQNKRMIKADGGTVILTAKAADQVLSAQVNNTGIIQARTMASLMGGHGSSGHGGGKVHVGTIKLLASGGTVHVAGKLDASAPKGGQGGNIETSGNKVTVADKAVITTNSSTGQDGNWLIDPDGFTIAASGGDMTGALLSSELATTNVSIMSKQGSGNGGLNDGNLNIDDAVTWTSTKILTLRATNDINFNAVVSGTNGGLTLTAASDIDVNVASAIAVNKLTATAGGFLNINAAQNWTTTNSTWTINTSGSESGVNVNSPVTWGGSTPLVFNSSNGTMNVNAPISGANAASALTLNVGTLNLNAPSVLQINTAVSGSNADDVNINAAQNWTTNGTWVFNVAVSIDVNAPLTFSAGSLTFNAGSNLNLNSTVNWSGGTLTLGAGHSIFVNNVLNATGTANLVVNYGSGTLGSVADGLYMSLGDPGTYTGMINFSSTGSVKLNGQTYTVINSVAGLDSIASNLSGNYVLSSSLTGLSATDIAEFGYPSANRFTGNFNGFGHTLALAPVSTISINSPLTLAALNDTNLVLASAGDININTAVTSGAGLLTFQAANNINLNAPVIGLSNNAQSFAFKAGKIAVNSSFNETGSNIFTNGSVSLAANATLTLSATNNIDIDGAVIGNGAATALTLNAGTDININGPINVNTLAATAKNNINDNGAITGSNAASVLTLNAGNNLNIDAPYSEFITATAGTININAAQNWVNIPTLTTSGIFFNAPVTWSSSTPQAINAAVIDVNAVMTGSDPASALTLNGNNFSVAVNVANAFAVNTLAVNATGAGILSINALQSWASAGARTFSGGTVNINGAMSWSSNGTLSIGASDILTINAPITGNGAASKLMLSAGNEIDIDAAAPPIVALFFVSPSFFFFYNTVSSSLAANTLTMTAANNININNPQYWSGSGAWTISGLNVNVYEPVTLTGNISLALSTTRAVNIYAPIIGSTGGLALNAGTDVNIDAALTLPPILAATAANDININVAQSWTTNGRWTFNGRDVNVNDPLTLSGSLTLNASNNVNVNSTVNWSSGTLTLGAGNNIFVNNVMNATGTASLVAAYGSGSNADGSPDGLYMGLANPGAFAGMINFSSTGGVKLNGQAYTVINSKAGLDAIASNLSGNYVLGSSLTGLSATDVAEFGYPSSNQFTGNFNGFGHTLALAPVSTISINSPLTIAALNDTNLVLASAGDININAAVTSGAGLLTFQAANNINLNASVSGNNSPGNSGSIALDAGNQITLGNSLTVTGHDIFINGTLAWAANTLTLGTSNLTDFIYVNGVMSASGTAALNVTYNTGVDTSTMIESSTGYLVPTSTAGTPMGGIEFAFNSTTGLFTGRLDVSNLTPGALTINNNAYTIITSMSQLSGISGVSGQFYALGQDLNAGAHTPGAGPNADGSYSANVVTALSSPLEGLGHTIQNLTIENPANASNVGLIGTVNANASIRDISLTNVFVDAGNGGGSGNAGSLAGIDSGSITNAYAYNVAVVSHNLNVGGLVGDVLNGSVDNGNVYNAIVYGASSTGGLVGAVTNNTVAGAAIIQNSSAVGGTYLGSVMLYQAESLDVFYNTPGRVQSNSAVTSTAVRSSFGGLVGVNDGGTINSSTSNIAVNFPTQNKASNDPFKDGESVGGLVGLNEAHTLTSTTAILAIINNSSSYGNVTAFSNDVGGFVGSNVGGVITGSHAYGNVTDLNPGISDASAGQNGPENIGGFAGYNTFGSVYIPGTTNQTAIGGVIVNSSSSGNVNVPNGYNIGGFIGGQAGGTLSPGVTSYSVAAGDISSGSVTGLFGVGGFIGSNQGAVYASSVSAGVTVSGNGAVGGFVGQNENGTISASTTAANVIGIPPSSSLGSQGMGGFAGENIFGSLGSSNSASGTVQGIGGDTGGFVGYNGFGGTIGPNNSSTSTMSGGDPNNSGSFVGSNAGTINNNNPTNKTNSGSNSNPGTASLQSIAQSAAASAQAVAASDAQSSQDGPDARRKVLNGPSSAPKPEIKIDSGLLDPIRPPPQKPALTQQRKVASTVTPPRKHTSGGGGFGASIRSIEVNGQRFDLQGKPQSGGKSP